MANNTAKSIHRKIIKDVRVKLKEEFDRNFERKAFFSKPWPSAKRNVKGSLLNRTSPLRRSITATERQDTIVFSSSLPYASIQNEGGNITITTQMKKFFWAMYYKSLGAQSKAYFNDDGSHKYTIQSSDNKQRMAKTMRSKSTRARAKVADAEYWKSLALKKVGDQLKIPPRPFIGNAPEVEQFIEDILHDNLKHIDEFVKKSFKKK